MSTQTDKIVNIINPTLEDMGFDLVRVKMLGGEEQQTLQIMAERFDDELMTVQHCAEISHAVSALLDVEDPISGAYNLEVSTPGLDRPLTRLKDFIRFEGFDANVELDIPIATGQKRFKGVIRETNDNVISFETPDDIVEFEFEDVSKAKLILTQKLLKSADKKQST